MGFLDDISSSLNRGKDAATRTGQQVKLNAEQQSLMRQRQGLAAQLGASLYEVTKYDPNLRVGREALYDGIAQIDARRTQIDQELAAIQQQAAESAAAAQTYRCPRCGTTVHATDTFCSGCGMPVSQIVQAAQQAATQAQATPEAPAQAPAAGGRVCPNCGAPVGPGENFCMNCGHRMEDELVAPAATAGAVDSAPVAPVEPVETDPVPEAEPGPEPAEPEVAAEEAEPEAETAEPDAETKSEAEPTIQLGPVTEPEAAEPEASEPIQPSEPEPASEATPAKAFCPNCGAEVSPDYRFCLNCGYKLK